jgi:hypothetical protein
MTNGKGGNAMAQGSLKPILHRIALGATCVIASLAAATAAGQVATAVEYYYADWDHYFVTSLPSEIAVLDGGAFGGVWKRTGHSFPVWSQAVGQALPTCRFFSTTFAPKSSHFYTPISSECEKLKANPNWQYEAVAFYLQLPASDSGACPSGTTTLYRLYNNGMGGAPNHRYTTDAATFTQMQAKGWIFEGDARTGAFACVPAVGNTSTTKGVWTGATNFNEGAFALLLEDGRYEFVYMKPGTSDDIDVVLGTASTSGNAFVSPDGISFPIAQTTESGGFSSPAPVSGSFAPGNGLQLTIATPFATRTFTGSFLNGSDTASSLSSIAGTYLGYWGHVDGRRAGQVTIDASGNLTGSNDVDCTITGTVTPRPSVHAFEWTITARSALNCIFGHGPLSGVLYYDEVTRKLHAFAPFTRAGGGADDYFFLGTKH